MTLTDFLLARIAEDEAVIAEARSRYGTDILRDCDLEVDWANVNLVISPVRVLAECEAKRRLVEMLETGQQMEADARIQADADPSSAERIDMHAVASAMRANAELACRVVVTIYSNHIDYQPEWRL